MKPNNLNLYIMKNSVVKNSVSKKATKKTLKELKARKPLTKEQKEARRLKRIANPQSSHLASNVYKEEQKEFRKDAKANLIEAKRRQNKVDLNKAEYENLVQLELAKKVVNVICRKVELIDLTIEAVRTNKDGSYSVFYFSQLVQKVVKLLSNDFTIETALIHIANVKKANKK